VFSNFLLEWNPLERLVLASIERLTVQTTLRATLHNPSRLFPTLDPTSHPGFRQTLRFWWLMTALFSVPIVRFPVGSIIPIHCYLF